MVKMDTYFNSYGKQKNDYRVQDCQKGDDIPFEKLSMPDIWGWIDFKIGNTSIMLEDNYDYIILLWIFIIEDLCKSELLKEKISIQFPDSSQTMEFTPVTSDKIQVTFRDTRQHRTAIADKKELLKEISREGIAFFKKIKELLPSEKESCEGYIMVLNLVKKAINNQ